MKKTMKQHSFASRLKSLALVFSIGLSFASCANEDIAQNPNGKDNDANLTTFSTGDPTTRTSMESDGKFFWEAGDKIYVKDDNNTWHASSNSPIGKTANFKFKVPGTYTAHTSYEVYYPGQGGSNDQAIIAASQSQAEPNTTTHFGAAGDCGMATATKVSGKQQFAFTLDHKAAYLLFLPRTSNTILHDCYLTKVEVNSDNDITDTYTLNLTTGALDASAGTGSKQIVLTTSGSSTNPNGFPLSNSSASVTTNGAYMVIKPGTHILKVRYWVKDVVTNVEGAITKTLPATAYASNTYYDMTANLNVRNYDGDKYYMWDAQEQYWKGHEWNLGGSQPTLMTQSASSDYPQNSSDPNHRYYNEGGGSGRFDATQSCATLPNANELSWYCMFGDPRWDGDKLWTTMGHLYKGGMWFKKKSVLLAEHNYDTEKSADGTTDLRTTYKNYNNTNSSINSGLPSAADANKYFYLPALGCYYSGQLNYVGTVGYYWSSSAYPWGSVNACYLYFDSGSVAVNVNYRNSGYRAEAFQ